MTKKSPWPPGFVSQMAPPILPKPTSALKSKAATRGRQKRAEAGIFAWGTETLEPKP